MKGILAAGIAPAICKAEWLMPVNSRILQPNWIEHAWVTSPSVVLYDRYGSVIAAKPLIVNPSSGWWSRSDPVTFYDLPPCEIRNAKVIIPGMLEGDIDFDERPNGITQLVFHGDSLTIDGINLGIVT